MVNIMAQSAAVKGHFSPVAGNNTRRVYDSRDNFLGVIVKCSEGYRVMRVDGKCADVE